MNDYVPYIVIYAGNKEDAKNMKIVMNILRDKLLCRGFKAILGIYEAYEEGNLSDEDFMVSDADVILYWFNNHVNDKEFFERKMNSFFNHADRGMVGCWPQSNVRGAIDEIVINCPNTLDEVADYIYLVYSNEMEFTN